MSVNYFKRKKNTGIKETLITNDKEERVEIGNPSISSPRRLFQMLSFHSIKSDIKLPSKVRDFKTDEQLNKEIPYDFVLVVANPTTLDAKQEAINNSEGIVLKELVERLTIAKFVTYMFYSNDKDQSKIFIKIKAPIELLREHAEEIEFLMKLDEEYAEKHIDLPHQKIGRGNDPDLILTTLSPYEYIFVKYTSENPEKFDTYNLGHPFTPIIRIKLILSLLLTDGGGCCALNLGKLKLCGSILDYYPIHQVIERDNLTRHWLSWKIHPWQQPYDQIKEYFGEKIALYYTFLGHYTTSLIPLAIAGIVVSFYISVQAGVDKSFNQALLSNYLLPFYCIFVTMWAQMLLETWKRKQIRKAMEWGQTEFEEKEEERPGFQSSTYEASLINGKPQKFVDIFEKFRKQCYSVFIITLMSLLVIGCVSLIFYVQYYVTFEASDDQVHSEGGTIASIASAIQIQVLGYFYNSIAISLTDDENHRTETEYEDALISKLFVFNFINSYASLVFIAFIKANVESCQGSCITDLAYQLAVIFVTNITVNKIQKFAYIYYKQQNTNEVIKQMRDDAMAAQDFAYEPSNVEKDFVLDNFSESLDTIANYSEIAVQYGYVTLFVVACPLSPLFAYLSNIIEIRSDGYTMLNISKRVIPGGAEDIGTWLTIFQTISYAAVISNAGLICFTMELVTIPQADKIWVFIAFQYVLLMAMSLFAYIVDDVPADVAIQLKRQEYLAELAELPEDDRERLMGAHKHTFTSIGIEGFSIENIHKHDEVDKS